MYDGLPVRRANRRVHCRPYQDLFCSGVTRPTVKKRWAIFNRPSRDEGPSMRGKIAELDLAEPDRLRLWVTMGVVPHDVGLPPRELHEPIVIWLIRCWEQFLPVKKGSQIRRAQQLVANLKVLDPNRCQLGCWRSDDDADERLLFAPFGFPSASLLGLMSSRLVRRSDFEQAWLGALRHSLVHERQPEQVVLSVADTATDALLRRCARLLKVPVISVRLCPKRDQLAHWFELALSEFVGGTVVSGECPLFASSSIPTDLTQPMHTIGKGSTSDATRPPEQDQLLLQLADDLIALSIRKDGHCHQLLSSAVAWASSPCSMSLSNDDLSTLNGSSKCTAWKSMLPKMASSRVRVVRDQRLTNAEVLESFAMLPSIQPHELRAESHTPVKQHSAATSAETKSDRLYSLTDWSQATDQRWLIHWTRGLESLALRDMPDELLAEWLAWPDATDRTACSSLKRLLVDQRLKAKRLGHAGDAVPVVCFSAMPLADLLRERVYQPHRTRWDAEPYGLCLRQDVVQRFGARPVVYGTSQEAETLPASDRLWFQPRDSTTSKGVIDWTHEQEWRLPGDFDLTLVPAGCGAIFVKTRDEAQDVLPLTSWPIVVMMDS